MRSLKPCEQNICAAGNFASAVICGLVARLHTSAARGLPTGEWLGDAQVDGSKCATRAYEVQIVPRVQRRWLTFLLLVTLPGLHALAQSDELNPEIDVYHQLTPDLRFDFQAMQSRQGSTPNSPEIGPSLDYYLHSLQSLRDLRKSGKDDSKAYLVVLSLGYRYLPTLGEPPINRMVPVVTINLPVPDAAILLSDRNRFDLDWKNGNYTWRYRNRLQFQRRVEIRSYRISPYASAEFFYESQYEKWSDTALYAGCLFPLGKHASFDPYYEHQNNTGKKPNQQLNQLGLILNLYF